MNNSFLDRIIIFQIVMAVVFFSYLPLLYFLYYLNAEKRLSFIFLLLIITYLFTLKKLCTKIKLNNSIHLFKKHFYVLFLYAPFGLYSLANFLIFGDFLNDTFTINTILIVNPIFANLAILCVYNKKDVIVILFSLSSIYFVFFIYQFFTTDLKLIPEVFLYKFSDMELFPYQNINYYLGIFTICNLRFFSSKSAIIRTLTKNILIFSILGMLFIGGRASFIALLLVLLIYFSKNSYLFSFKKPTCYYKKVLTICIAIIVIFSLDFILPFFKTSVTGTRLLALTEASDPSLRIFLFGKAIDLFLSSEKTFLFGAGINSFPIYISAYSTGYYPHNLLLELLAEYGVFGTILFSYPVIYILRLRKKKLGSVYGNTADEQTIFLLFMYLLTIHMFTSGIRYSWVLIYFTFLLIPNSLVTIKNWIYKPRFYKLNHFV